MPRVQFAEFDARADTPFEALIPRPLDVPQGYTPVMLVCEWLTLNCYGDWACRANHKGLRVRFASRSDRDRAVARFVAHPDVVVGLTKKARRAPAVRRVDRSAQANG